MSTFVPTGKIDLIKNVDIDISYTHQYYFANSDAQDTFFSSKVFQSLTNGTYQRKNINSIQVPFEADAIRECKYLRWKNSDYDNTKWYYAFVTSIDYINPGVSQINYQLDVYQTFLFDVTWKQSFIEREHTARWSYEDNVAVPAKNTEPEGLEYGSEYKVISETKLEQIPDVGWLVLGTTKLPVNTVPHQIGNKPTGIIYVVVPVYIGQKKSCLFKVGSTYLSTPGTVLNLFANDTELVNSLVSAVFYPFMPVGTISYTFTTIDTTSIECALTLSGIYDTTNITPGGTAHYALTFDTTVNGSDFITPVNLQDTHNPLYGFPQYTESKLFMFPYSFIELTTKRGDSRVIKMEYLDAYTTPIRIGCFGTVSFQNKVTYAIRNYLSDVNGYNITIGLNDDSNSSLPITDSYTASYIQSNSNAIEVSKSNARASMQTVMDNAYRSFNTAIPKSMKQLAGNMMGNIGEGVAGALGMAAGYGTGSAGAITGGGGAVINAITSMVNSGISTSNNIDQASTYLANAYDSALTDFSNAVATVMAKKNDAEQIPPTAKSLGGDYLFNMCNDCYAVYLIRKTIYPEYANKLQDYFNQYGYKVNRLETPNFRSRLYWNYFKMTEPNVYGNIPMDDLMKIRDIFIKGITLWHGDYIGDYTKANVERT